MSDDYDSYALHIVSIVIGYIYTVAWGVSFMG